MIGRGGHRGTPPRPLSSMKPAAWSASPEADTEGVDRNVSDHPSCTMFANCAAAEPADCTSGDQEGHRVVPSPGGTRPSLWPSTLGHSFSCCALAAQGRWRVRNAGRLGGVSPVGRWLGMRCLACAPLGPCQSAPETGWTHAPGPVRATTPGQGCPGVVARSDVDAVSDDAGRAARLPTVRQLNRQTARPATWRAIGLCHPPVAHDRLCGPPLLGVPSRAGPWLRRADGGSVTPAAWLAFHSRSVVRGYVLACAPWVAHRPRRPAGLSARPGPGYDPGASLPRGRSALRGRCCLGRRRPGRRAYVSRRRRPVQEHRSPRVGGVGPPVDHVGLAARFPRGDA